MKKHFFKLFFATSILFALTSCNNQKTNEEPLVVDEVSEEVETTQYVIDIDNSTMNWEGYKPLLRTTHTGLISLKEGKFDLKDDKVVAGVFVIDMKSIEVTDLEGEYKENLEAHLMGTVEGKEDDFFNVNEFPTAEFSATGTSSKDGKTYLVGNLTLRGKTQEVGFPVEINKVEDGLVEIVSEPFKIDRTKWDIKFASKSFFDNLGENFVGDDMQIEFKIVAKQI